LNLSNPNLQAAVEALRVSPGGMKGEVAKALKEADSMPLDRTIKFLQGESQRYYALSSDLPTGWKADAASETAYDLERVVKHIMKNHKAALLGPSQSSVKTWMRKMVSDYVDPKTDEVNMTDLAEAAADEFNAKELGGWLDDEGHWVWDLAQQVSDEWDRKHKKSAITVAEKFAAVTKKATSPEQWEKGAKLIEDGAKGDVNRIFQPRVDDLDAQMGRIQKAFTDAASTMEKHKKLGVGRTESPALLLRPLREMKEMKEMSRLMRMLADRFDKTIAGALKDTGSHESDL
jgi:hypothetical protein